MALRFSKYEGLGNDFVIVDGEAAELEKAKAQAVQICDRHRGVGADGVLLVGRGPEPSMVVVNADGSMPQMCGNGLRCVALHLHRTGAVGDGPFMVQTGAGPHRCEVFEDGRVQVDTAVANLEPATLPMAADVPVIDQPYRFAGQEVRLTGVSMGNPHAVLFDVSAEDRMRVGPAISKSELFPEGVNVGFARRLDDGDIELHVLERGAGWTEACGTGACACAVAAVRTERAKRGEPITIHLPGGPLEILVTDDNAPIRMTGPARHVFDGVLAG